MNLWQNNILLRTAKVVVTYLSVLLKTEYEQIGSQTITSILLNISNRLSQSPYTRSSLYFSKGPVREPVRYYSSKVFNSTVELNPVN